MAKHTQTIRRQSLKKFAVKYTQFTSERLLRRCFGLVCVKFFGTTISKKICELVPLHAFICHTQCVKSIHIQSFSGPYFPAFGLNTEIYEINLRIQSEFRKMQTRKTPDMDSFYAVTNSNCSSCFFFILQRRI